VLPDHVQALITLLESDDKYSILWKILKSTFTRELIKKGYSFSRNSREEYDVWQRYFWEHTMKYTPKKNMTELV